MRTYRLAGTVVDSEGALFMEALEQDYISAKNVEKILAEAGGEEAVSYTHLKVMMLKYTLWKTMWSLIS